MYGKAEYLKSNTQTIFIGPEIGINDYKKVGICLKGTTFIWNIIPFSLVIDPKYDFGQKEFIWDLKCSIGLGRHKPIDKLFGRGRGGVVKEVRSKDRGTRD